MFLEYIYSSLKGFFTFSVMLLAFSIASDIPAALNPLNIIAFLADAADIIADASAAVTFPVALANCGILAQEP